MSDSSTVVLFEGGLDVVTPIQNTAPGTLVDCLNYEVGPISGYRRIDGYERFDNYPDGGIGNLYIITVEVTNQDPSYVIPIGSMLYTEEREVMGVIGEPVFSNSVYQYIPARPSAALIAAQNYVGITPSGVNLEVTALSTATDYREAAADAEDFYSTIRDASYNLRIRVNTAPRPIAGVYYGRKSAYAVVDLAVWDFSATAEVLEIGKMYRHNGMPYVLVSFDGAVAYMAEIVGKAGLNTGVAPITYGSLITGASGSEIVGVDTEYPVPADGALYGQPYILQRPDSGLIYQRGYQPQSHSYYITYDTGTEEPGSTITIDLGGGVTVVATVVSYTVDEGSFGAGDAAGTIYFYVTGVSTSSAWDGVIDVGAEFNNGGSAVGEVVSSGVALWAGTGGLRYVDDDKLALTHYVWGTYNFKATEGHQMVFATNGFTRAGWIDETSQVYGNVYTQADTTKDNPKYVAFHAGQRLMLGFETGSVQLSAVTQPLNFSGLDGAVEIGNGDSCTGLLEATGDSTLVYGPRTIRRVIGEGSTLALRTVSASAGAFDYTATSVAGAFLHTNQNGICTLDQTSAYGDFRNAAISGAIDTWLTPRIVQDTSTIELGGVVCAFPVRAKNQYRLFLGDGSVISMAVTTKGPQPMNTNYKPSANALRVPLAWSSSVATDGTEYLLAVWDQRRAMEGDRGVVEDLPSNNIIYRLDRGWGFDGLAFSSYMDTAYMFNEDPMFLTISKAVLYGLGYGMSNLLLKTSNVEDSFGQSFEVTNQDISAPRNPEIMYKSLSNVLGEIDHANWGRAIKLRFISKFGMGSEETEPPHILQSVRLFVQTDGIGE